MKIEFAYKNRIAQFQTDRFEFKTIKRVNKIAYAKVGPD